MSDYTFARQTASHAPLLRLRRPELAVAALRSHSADGSRRETPSSGTGEGSAIPLTLFSVRVSTYPNFSLFWPVHREIDERANRHARRAFRQVRLTFVEPGRARDIQMHPRLAFNELLQELGSGNRAAPSSADVRQDPQTDSSGNPCNHHRAACATSSRRLTCPPP